VFVVPWGSNEAKDFAKTKLIPSFSPQDFIPLFILFIKRVTSIEAKLIKGNKFNCF
jgi:hypothetical protein